MVTAIKGRFSLGFYYLAHLTTQGETRSRCSQFPKFTIQTAPGRQGAKSGVKGIAKTYHWGGGMAAHLHYGSRLGKECWRRDQWDASGLVVGGS